MRCVPVYSYNTLYVTIPNNIDVPDAANNINRRQTDIWPPPVSPSTWRRSPHHGVRWILPGFRLGRAFTREPFQQGASAELLRLV